MRVQQPLPRSPEGSSGLLLSSTALFVCPGLMPQGLYHCSFVECLHAGQTSPITLLFFLENDWAILDPLHFHSSYRIRLSRSTNVIFVVKIFKMFIDIKAISLVRTDFFTLLSV